MGVQQAGIGGQALTIDDFRILGNRDFIRRSDRFDEAVADDDRSLLQDRAADRNDFAVHHGVGRPDIGRLGRCSPEQKDKTEKKHSCLLHLDLPPWPERFLWSFVSINQLEKF